MNQREMRRFSFADVQRDVWNKWTEFEGKCLQNGTSLLLPVRLLLTDKEVALRFGLSPYIRSTMKRTASVLVLSPFGEKWSVSVMKGKEVGKPSGVAVIRKGYIEIIKHIQSGPEYPDELDLITFRKIAHSLFDLLPRGTQEELRAQGLAPETVLTVLEE